MVELLNKFHTFLRHVKVNHNLIVEIDYKAVWIYQLDEEGSIDWEFTSGKTSVGTVKWRTDAQKVRYLQNCIKALNVIEGRVGVCPESVTLIRRMGNVHG